MDKGNFRKSTHSDLATPLSGPASRQGCSPSLRQPWQPPHSPSPLPPFLFLLLPILTGFWKYHPGKILELKMLCRWAACLQRCRPPTSLVSRHESMICDISGCCRRHTFYCQSDPISFDACRSGPVLSRNGSLVTTGIGARWKPGSRIVGISANEELIAIDDCQSLCHRLKYIWVHWHSAYCSWMIADKCF